MRDPARIPCAPAPEFLAILRAVPGDAVTTHDKQFGTTIVFERNGSAIGFMRLHFGIRRPDVLPELLARLRFQREQIRVDRPIRAPATMDRFIALENLDK